MSSSSSLLPPVGTRFASLLKGKLAAFEVAKAGSFRLSTFSSTADLRLEVVCIGRGTQKNLKDPSNACTCKIVFYRRKEGDFEVTTVNDQHSCRLAPPGSTTARSNAKYMAKRILQIKRRAASEACRSNPLLSERNGKRTRATEAAASEDGQAIDSTSDSSSATTTDEEEDELHETQKPTQARLKQPSMRQGRLATISKRGLAREYKQLAQRCRLALPSPQQLFPTARSALLHLHAWAQQNGVWLNHYSSTKKYQVVCKPSSKVYHCSFELEVVELSGGSWVVKVVNSKHDAAVHKKAGAAMPCEKSPALPFSSSQPTLSQNSLFRQPRPIASPPHPSADLLISPTNPLPFSALVPSDHSSRTDPTLRSLSFFLYACFPSAEATDISRLSSNLFEGGCKSVDDLATLLNFEESSVLNLVKEIGVRKGWTADESKRVEEIFGAVRKAFIQEA